MSRVFVKNGMLWKCILHAMFTRAAFVGVDITALDQAETSREIQQCFSQQLKRVLLLQHLLGVVEQDEVPATARVHFLVCKMI